MSDKPSYTDTFYDPKLDVRYEKKPVPESDEIQNMGDELLSTIVAQNLVPRAINGKFVLMAREDAEELKNP